MGEMLKRILLILLLFPGFCRAGARVIEIGSQADFDRLDFRIHTLIAQGEIDIVVRFAPGTFFFHENHLRLEGMERPDVSIVLQGNDTRLVGDCPVAAGPFDPHHGFVDLATGRNLDYRMEVRQAKGRPEAVDRNQGVYRFLTDESSLLESQADAAWIVLTQWFRGVLYKVLKIEKGYVYFQCDHPVSQENAYYDLDGDYHFGKRYPRYILYNGRMSLPKKGTVHECAASRFLLVSGSSFKRISVSGINFFGNGGGDILFYLYRSSADGFDIRNCVFDSIRSDAVVAYFTKNLTFSDNELLHLYRNGVVVGFESDRAAIIGNRFCDVGLLLDNSACVRNQASETRIADNTFVDFSYCAISSGIHYTETMSGKCTSLIEGNEIYQTDAFRKKPSRTLMDSGAIYVTTISQGQVIRNNYIHDIDGPWDNRGIFLDDGAVGVEVYGNLILGVKNSYCIDARRVRWVETHPKTRITRVNVNNYIGRNIVDGRVRYETRGGRDGCRKRPNTVLAAGYDRDTEVARWRKRL